MDRSKGGQLSVAFYPIQGISSEGERCPTCSEMVGGSNPSFPVHSSANSLPVYTDLVRITGHVFPYFLIKSELMEPMLKILLQSVSLHNLIGG